jgi:hypothetical protein
MKYLIFYMVLIVAGCSDKRKQPESSSNHGKTDSLANASLIFTAGEFIRLQPLDGKWHLLLLKNKNGNIDSFHTMMPLGPFEIGQLKPDTINIKILYQPQHNPVTSNVNKIVKTMEPIYEWKPGD